MRSGKGRVDAQSFLDSKFQGNYNVYLGVMWTRFGSPTTEADSGTEHEFRKAVAAHKKGAVREIMFYFLNQPADPATLDGAQLEKVQKFKQFVGSQKVYYQELPTRARLINKITEDLAKLAAEFQNKQFRPNPKTKAKGKQGIPGVSKTSILASMRRLNGN